MKVHNQDSVKLSEKLLLICCASLSANLKNSRYLDKIMATALYCTEQLYCIIYGALKCT